MTCVCAVAGCVRRCGRRASRRPRAGLRSRSRGLAGRQGLGLGRGAGWCGTRASSPAEDLAPPGGRTQNTHDHNVMTTFMSTTMDHVPSSLRDRPQRGPPSAVSAPASSSSLLAVPSRPTCSYARRSRLPPPPPPAWPPRSVAQQQQLAFTIRLQRNPTLNSVVTKGTQRILNDSPRVLCFDLGRGASVWKGVGRYHSGKGAPCGGSVGQM